mmetsp:Transcript_8500/g.27974  ORF Transcript_8500/g.27974 Transcript_8500/m.27974 type:complete len:232 (-) Transcript_8500:564-1259(-)
MRHRSCNSMTSFLLDQVGDIHRHLIDLGGVVLLDVAEDADVVALDKVDGNALAAEAARPANAMDVELAVVGQIVVDDQRDLLHVDAAAPDVGGDENTRVPRPELGHNRIALLLGHVAVHGRDREVGLPHLVGEPVHLLLGVAEDDCLCDGQSVVKVAQRVELPLLTLDRHEELLDAFERKLVTLDQDPDGVRHELARHLQNLARKRGTDQHHLRGGGQVAINVVDLLLEAL